MGTASVQFILFGLAVALLSNLNRSTAWRQVVLLLGSLGFMAFFTTNLVALIPLASFVAFGFFAVTLLQRNRSKAFFVLLLIFGIAAFVWLKKYSFVPAALLLKYPYFALGLSYIFFRVLHLIIDGYGGNLPEKIRPVTYLNYTLNFTTLISGPIQTYQDFVSMQLAEPPLAIDMSVAGRAAARILIGFFKVNVASLFLSMARSSAMTLLLDANGTDKVIAGAVVVSLYPLYLYANFSGYIDIVIGIARFLRIELPENFDRPFSSKNFMVFWNRWHITLSSWLKTYVYNPLVMACMQRWPSSGAEPFIVAIGFFVTFFLIGIWHGPTSEFAFYGVLLGLGVSAVKLYQMYMQKRLGKKRFNALGNNWVYGSLARGATYTWYSFSMIWFWSSWPQISAMAASLSRAEMCAVWLLILATFSFVLAAWEIVRAWLLSFEFENRPALLSRYALTVWCTVLTVISVAITAVLNAPAPDIVYKAF